MISSKDSKTNDWVSCERIPWKNSYENSRKNLWKKTQKIYKKILEVIQKIKNNNTKPFKTLFDFFENFLGNYQNLEFPKKVTRSIREEVLRDFLVHFFSCSGRI